MSFLFYILFVIVSISLCIVAFLLIAAGDLETFRSIHKSPARNTILPIISKYGEIISSPQDLDFHIAGLKVRLREKYQNLENFKIKVQNQLKTLDKFESYKKNCNETKENLAEIAAECSTIQEKLDYYKKVQIRIQEDFFPRAGYKGDADLVTNGNGNTRALLL